jgi:VanZ family protein
VVLLWSALFALFLCVVEAKKKKNVCIHRYRNFPSVFQIFLQLKSDVEKMKDSCLLVVATSALVVCCVEAVNYFVSYRRPSFRANVSKLINAVCSVAIFVLYSCSQQLGQRFSFDRRHFTEKHSTRTQGRVIEKRLKVAE